VQGWHELAQTPGEFTYRPNKARHDGNAGGQAAE